MNLHVLDIDGMVVEVRLAGDGWIEFFLPNFPDFYHRLSVAKLPRAEALAVGDTSGAGFSLNHHGMATIRRWLAALPPVFGRTTFELDVLEGGRVQR